MNTLFPERYSYMVLQEVHFVLFMDVWADNGLYLKENLAKSPK